MKDKPSAGSTPTERFVRLRGPLDRWGVIKLRLRVLVPFATGCKRLILDLRKVPYIDSDGVRALQTIVSDFGDGQIEVRHANPRVQRTLQLSLLADDLVLR